MFQKSVVPKNVVFTFVAAALLAGCGGGGSAAGLYGTPQPVGSPQPVPTPARNSALATLSLKGSPGFINPAGHSVYVFDADLANPGHSVCNGACAQNWPPVSLVGKTVGAPFSMMCVTTEASNSHTLVGHSTRSLLIQPEGQTNGDDVNAFGGLWHIARPSH
jgi:predicted lipoprotein with Yx(FWY)xxD motif